MFLDQEKNSQILVVGGTGQTGRRLLERLSEIDGARLIATSRDVKEALPAGPLASTVLHDARRWGQRVEWMPLDLESEGPALKQRLMNIGEILRPDLPTALILVAAYTNVDGCEVEPERCRRINEESTQAVAYWARRRFGAKIVFYSTDYVFDGSDGPYPETARRSPAQRYGESKAFFEEWLERNAPESLIVRTTGVYDYLPGSKNFLMQMLELWKQGKSARVASDQYANPVSARELARATVELLVRGASGIYHVGGGSYLPRHGFAGAIARAFGRDPSLIEGVATVTMEQKAKRPLRGGLKCEKLENELGWAPLPVAEALDFFLRENS